MQLEETSRVLKSGTNQFKLIEFRVGRMVQGINLIKVKKIIAFKGQHITPVFESKKEVLGILEIGGQIISIIDLREFYGLPESSEDNIDQKVIIITEFNYKQFGFVADEIVMVHRLSWADLQPVSDTCPSDVVVAVAPIKGTDILIIDFELIVDKLYPKALQLPADIISADDLAIERRKHARIICVDDSNIIRKKLTHIFEKHQFIHYTVCSDGAEAYGKLIEVNQAAKDDEGYTFMITDIEMPQMDGLTLCKKTKDAFPKIPVLVLSSLVSDQLKLKCKDVGADAAVSKADLPQLVSVIDDLMLKQDLEKQKRIGKKN